MHGTREPVPWKYAAAQELIRLGRWTIDLDTGRIFGVRGKEFVRCSASGYTQAHTRHGNLMVHRILWEYVHGPIPDQLQINHINGVKTDNRPSNLEMVTHLENMRHARRTGLNTSGFAPGTRNDSATLAPEQVLDIYRRFQAGESGRALSAEFGIGYRQVKRIKAGHAWAHLTRTLVG